MFLVLLYIYLKRFSHRYFFLNQILAIDITDRSPSEHGPGGIPYKLLMEACTPGIDTSNLSDVFEEHHVCRSQHLLDTDDTNKVCMQLVFCP